MAARRARYLAIAIVVLGAIALAAMERGTGDQAVTASTGETGQ